MKYEDQSFCRFLPRFLPFFHCPGKNSFFVMAKTIFVMAKIVFAMAKTQPTQHGTPFCAIMHGTSDSLKRSNFTDLRVNDGRWYIGKTQRWVTCD